MSGLPEHRKDLEELRAEIDAKLAALSQTPIKLAVTGEWIETNGQPCIMPEGVTKTNTKGEWMSNYGQSVPINSFDTDLWSFRGIKAIRLTRLPPILNLNGETAINYYRGLINLPDNIGDYEYKWYPKTPWLDGILLKNWTADSWAHVTTMTIRPKEQKVKVEIEFTTYVPGVTKFKPSGAYLVIFNDGSKGVFKGANLFYDCNIKSYCAM